MLDKNKVLLGIAPIGWTNDDLPELGSENTFEQCVSEMALAGFIGSEVGNKYPKDPVKLKKALDLRGITICNAWFSTYFTTKPQSETIEAFIKHRDFLHAVGAKVIGASEQGNSIQGLMDTSVFASKPLFSENDWTKLSQGLNLLGKLAQEKDMILTYHHHMGTGVQLPNEIDKLMELTDPNLVYLLYDTGHLVFAGCDTLETAKKYAKRIRHIHLKDVRREVLKECKAQELSFLKAVKRGVFTVPGDGMIDFKPIFKVFEESGYSGWMVVEAEQDPAKANPFEYALKAREYIRQTAGI